MPNQSRHDRMEMARKLLSYGHGHKPAASTGDNAQLLDAQMRAARDDELDNAFMLLLNEDGLAGQDLLDRVDEFKDIAAKGAYDMSCLQVVEHGSELVHAGFYVVQDGGTSMMMTSSVLPSAAQHDEVRRVAVDSLKCLADKAFAAGSNILQVMIGPQDAARKQLCLDSGYEYLTDLIYLACLTSVPLGELDFGDGFSWLSYDQQHHDLFAHAILRSYVNSMDCRELEPYRDIEDIITGHKAAGSFDRSYWRLLLKGATAVGILLLSPIPTRETLELTYMGIDPEFRGMGLGRYLLLEAVAVASRSGAKSLSLAVDCRNKPAVEMYIKCGLAEILRRSVLLRIKDGSLAKQ